MKLVETEIAVGKSAMKLVYDREFLRDCAVSLESAREVVPLVLGICSPRRVIDIGCGIGTWLAEFQKRGIVDICGVDGDYVDRDILVIPPDKFVAADLAKPLQIDGVFDLAMSLEVAEHLPESAADLFVDAVAGLAPMVLFSGAVPLQGGVHHVNEQWQDYWAEKFERRGFVTIDFLRPKLWGNAKVAYWYAQNMLLYVRADEIAADKRLNDLYQATNRAMLRVVHPGMFLPPAGLVARMSKAVPSPVRSLLKRIVRY